MINSSSTIKILMAAIFFPPFPINYINIFLFDPVWLYTDNLLVRGRSYTGYRKLLPIKADVDIEVRKN